MEYSVELARFLGLVLTIMCLGLLIHRKHFLQIADNLVVSPAVQFVGTIVPLIVGSFIIVTHNIWVGNWTVLVTLVGWLIFLAGTFRAFFPTAWISTVKAKSHGAGPIIASIVLLIVGIVLLFCGFYTPAA